MRMWMVDTKKLCRQHLLAEHSEMHMFAGALAHNHDPSRENPRSKTTQPAQSLTAYGQN